MVSNGPFYYATPTIKNYNNYRRIHLSKHRKIHPPSRLKILVDAVLSCNSSLRYLLDRFGSAHFFHSIINDIHCYMALEHEHVCGIILVLVDSTHHGICRLWTLHSKHIQGSIDVVFATRLRIIFAHRFSQECEIKDRECK